MKLGLLFSGFCVVSSLASGAAASDYQALLTLARTPPEDYPTQRTEFLRTHTNRYDVVAATKAGWEAGLMALIVNSRLDHPVEYQRADASKPFRSMGKGGFIQFDYGLMTHAGSPEAASAFELLWKGGRRGAPGRPAPAVTNEFGEFSADERWNILPSSGRRSLKRWQDSKAGTTFPESLLLAIVRSNAPEDVKAMASYFLAASDSEAAEATLFHALTNAEWTARTKQVVFVGIDTYSPRYAWAVMSGSHSGWGQDTNLNWRGYHVLVGMTNSLGPAVVRSIALDKNAPTFSRCCAVSALDSRQDTEFETFKPVVLDPSTPAELKLRAVGKLDSYPTGKLRRLIEEADINGLGPEALKGLLDSIGARSAILSRLMSARSLSEGRGDSAVAEPDELRFIRSLAVRSDLSPELRKVAEEVVDEVDERWLGKPTK